MIMRRMSDGRNVQQQIRRATERGVNLLQEATAQTEPRLALSKRLVHRNQGIKDFSFARGQLIEPRLESFLEILQNERMLEAD